MVQINDELIVELTDAIVRLSELLERTSETQIHIHANAGHDPELVKRLVSERFKSVTR